MQNYLIEVILDAIAQHVFGIDAIDYYRAENRVEVSVADLRHALHEAFRAGQGVRGGQR
ncbi:MULTISPECIES: hypothetical protein [Paraburkholderia]|uniref:Uncharacterized protein n=1 Tax=Paraburkholderia acidicola TaxID=1912599 RepID=A0ABV1M0T2_9BURK